MNLRKRILTASLLASGILMVPGVASAAAFTDQDTSGGSLNFVAGDTVTSNAKAAVTMNTLANSVTNAGTITGTAGKGFEAIKVVATGGTFISNAVTGIITSADNASSTINIATDVLTVGITNFGLIEQNTVNTQNAILIGKSFAKIDNQAGGIIQSTVAGGTAIKVGAAATGNFINAGTITGDTKAIHISGGVLTGDITNNTGGIIQATAAAGQAISITNATTTNIVNTGTLQGGANAVQVTAAVTGGITNKTGGTIKSTAAGSAIVTTAAVSGGITNEANATIQGLGGRSIELGGDANITNAGNILTNNTAAIEVAAGKVSTITNSGEIKGTAAAVMGIKFNGGANQSIVNTGKITGTGAGSRAVQVTTGASTGTLANNVGGVISVDAGEVAIDNVAFGFAGITNAGRIDAGAAGTAISIGAAVGTPVTSTGAIVGNVVMGTGLLTLNNGATLAGNVTSAGGAAVTIDVGNGSFTSGGTIDTTGAVTLTGGTINLNHVIGGATVPTTVGLTAGTLNLNANIAATNLNNNGTGVIALTKSFTDTGIFNQTGGTLQVTLTDKNNFGQLKVTGNVNMTAAGKLALVVPAATSSNILNGDVFDVVTVGGAVTADAATFVPANSLLLTFTKGVAPNGKDIRITAARRSFSSLATSSDVTGVGAALDTILATPPVDAGFRAVFDQLATFTTADQVNSALRTLTNDSSGGAQQAAHNSHSRLTNLLANRLNILNLAENEGDLEQAGYAAGNGEDSAMWLQGFGGNINQKLRNGIQGYDADLWGAAIGVDSFFGPCLALGLAGSYTYTDTDTKAGIRNNSKVKSYQGSLYGSLNLGGSYIDGMFTYARNDYKTVRTIAVGAVGFRALGDFDGSLFGARLAYNMPTHTGDLTITPTVFAAWSHTRQDAYSERNAGVLGLRVQNQTDDVLDLGLGARFDYHVGGEHGAFTPQFELNISQDVVGKTPQSINNFVGGGPRFVVRGASKARTTVDAGLGFTVAFTQDLRLVAVYNAAFKQNYVGQTGSATLRYSF